MSFINKLLVQAAITAAALGYYYVNHSIFHWSQGVSGLLSALIFSGMYHEVRYW